MYVYDTRSINSETLPLDGWFFPCTKCYDITGLFKTDIYIINCCYSKTVNIPLCYKCIHKYKININELNKNKIKYQSD